MFKMNESLRYIHDLNNFLPPSFPLESYAMFPALGNILNTCPYHLNSHKHYKDPYSHTPIQSNSLRTVLNLFKR